MVSEQGPERPLRADETPTETFQAIGPEQFSLPPISSAMPAPEMPARNRERRQLKVLAGLAIVLVAVVGVAAYEVVSGVGNGKQHPVAAAAVSHASTVPSSAPAAAPSSPAASPSPVPTPSLVSPSPTPSAAPAVIAARPLKPAGVTEVDPGSSTGGGSVDLVLDGSTSTAWETEWYTTPEFGGLQSGIGLLVNMGRSATITDVQVTLGSEPGAAFEVRAGESSSKLKTVATEAGVGGTVQVKLASPARARYVLIWFTKLPPNGSGHYQVEVYNIQVKGQP